MSNVKGSAVTARLRFVRERFGEPGVARVSSLMEPDHVQMMEGKILPSAWVPFDLFTDLNLAIDRAFGRGDLALCYEVGRFASEANLPTLYKLFYRFGTPGVIFRKAAQLWDVHYDSGRLVAVESAPREYRLTIENFDTPHRTHCLSVLGWATRSAELSGASVYSYEETQCRVFAHDVCEMIIRWR